MVKTRILVAFEARYHVYQGAIASAIRKQRPQVEVATAEPGEFKVKMARFDPHMVICTRTNTVIPNGRLAWIEFFSLDPEMLAAICLNGEYWESDNPGLEELLAIVDETDRLARTKHDLGDC